MEDSIKTNLEETESDSLKRTEVAHGRVRR